MQFFDNRPYRLLIVFLALSFSTFAQPSPKKTPPLARPKLVVGIVVDQMRYDYLYRFYDKYGEGGLKRLMNEGFNCRNNHYSYALTVTAAGHSAVYTGSVPAINGIIGNDWFDPIAGKGVYCAEDTTVTTVGSTNASAGKMSPRNLLTSTITDQLQLGTNFRSKTVGIAIKDRGAILPAGHTATGAYWFDSKTGNWITSTFYTNELPKWAQEVNDQKLPAKYLKDGWKTLLPIEQYVESTPDDRPYENKLAGNQTSAFPYDLAGRAGDAFGIIASTPFGNTMTKDMAIAAIKGENMGKGQQTDFLAVSFSSPDYVGHAFGPNSVEVEDVYLRLDREFAELFTFLDSWTGKGNYTVFLTADHGVTDVPAFWNEHRLNAGVLNNGTIKNNVNNALEEAFGKGDYIRASENYQMYLNHATLKQKKIKVQEVFEVVREALLPVPGVADVINLAELGKSSLNSYQLELYKNLINAKRSGDLQIVMQPGWFSGSTRGTTHGSPYNGDTHVPLLFYGWGIPKGETLRRTAIPDIAPTIAALLHLLPPNGTVGNPIPEALK
ncbi:alkaline phosphatase PafA [Salmonirosea aquatica]|uniref:Alkaline phosphatase family protein n=1 Tax=Salmonirosea aquatica TaxID=2654236 RepID=A0A7C9FBE4_9BACT|nr:alkaline phosphatase family protein [Cytophagaceae bacterium SJW1-29]